LAEQLADFLDITFAIHRIQQLYGLWAMSISCAELMDFRPTSLAFTARLKSLTLLRVPSKAFDAIVWIVDDEHCFSEGALRNIV
jgi:hypothetical protein